MNLITVTQDDPLTNAAVSEITRNGQQLFRAFVHLGRTAQGVVAIEGYGLTELAAIEDCTDKAVTFGKLLSINLSEGFSTRRMELRQEAANAAYKEMATKLGLTADPKPTKPESDN